MELLQPLYRAAVELIDRKYPEGWGGASAMYTDRGSILTSISPEVVNLSTEISFEVGAICEAHKNDERVTHVVSVIRDDFQGNGTYEYKVLAPCGVCQEMLFYWGEEVRCTVQDEAGGLVFKTLRELQPYYWRRAYYGKSKN